MTTHHVISFSGGKDSTALVLLALEWSQRKGFSPIVVFADTGHEHPMTYEYVELVERHTGLTIRRVKADFSADFTRKRTFIQAKWPADGVPPERVARAMEALHPTGNPFLDLCMLKGRFPSTRARFCSQELKARPIYEQVLMPLMKTGRVLSWQGVRAEESAARAAMPRMERGDGAAKRGGRWVPSAWIWRPILHWTVDQVFEMHRRHGLEPNPLYTMGMRRVGCMPCIHAGKAELTEIAKRFPEEIARVAEWEDIIGAVCKRPGIEAFFASDKTPQGAADKVSPIPRIAEVVEWARTSRGGRQYNLIAAMPAETCSSLYGLCE